MRSSQNWFQTRKLEIKPLPPRNALTQKAWLPRCLQHRGVLLSRNLPAPPGEKKGLTTGFLANNMRVIRHYLVKIHHLHSLVRTYPLLTVSRVFNQTAEKT